MEKKKVDHILSDNFVLENQLLIVRKLGLMVTLCVTVWETSTLFSKEPVPLYIPTSSVWGVQFLHILANTWFCLSFWLEPAYWLWNDIWSCFQFAFPFMPAMLNIYSCVYRPFLCLQRSVYSNPLPILKFGLFVSLTCRSSLFHMLGPYQR